MRFLLVHDGPLSDGYRAWLYGEIQKLGIQSADCEELNLIEEKPTKSGLVPTIMQIKANQKNFYEKLAESSARVLIPFGPHAARAVLGRKDGIESLRGYVFSRDDLGQVTYKEKKEEGVYKSGAKKGTSKLVNVTITATPALPENAIVIPTYSVAYIITKRRKPFFAFVQDIRRAKTAADGGLILDDSVFDARRAFSTEPIQGWIPKGSRFAFDIEVAAILGGYSREPRSFAGFSVSDGVTTMCLDWNEQTRDYVAPYLANPAYQKFAHNSMFDTSRLRDAGAPVAQPIMDTMIMAQLLQADLLKRLESVASVYLNIKQWKALSDTDEYFYSAKDSYVTMLLADELEKRLRLLGMTELSERVCQALPVLLDMQEQGLKVDVTRASKWAEELKEKLTVLGTKWVVQTAPHKVNPASPPQLHKYLYGTLGMVPQKNKSDGSTVDGEALFNLKRLYPAHAQMITILEEYRGTNKAYGTYAKTLAGLFNSGEDRVHPQYLPGGSEGESFGAKGGASTGRLGVRDPNIQNQTPAARQVYVPDDAEQVFLEFDYSQAELRVIAALARDENLQRALEEDIHQRTADRLGIPRALAKNVLYASCYLGGAKTIQSMMKKHGTLIDIPTIKNAQALIRAEYPRMAAWQQATVAEGTNKGYLVNPFGRVRFFYGGRDDGPEMADFLPQSSIADITYKVLPDLAREARGLGGRLVTTVHDSFLLQLPAGKLRHMYVFKEILEQTFDEIAPGFSIPVAIKYGEPGGSWGSLSEEKANV
jgi:DNA polymerase I-like protein with 3'-5' exonuclease and polymerase domains